MNEKWWDKKVILMATKPEPWDAGNYLSKIVFGFGPKVLLTNEDLCCLQLEGWMLKWECFYG